MIFADDKRKAVLIMGLETPLGAFIITFLPRNDFRNDFQGDLGDDKRKAVLIRVFFFACLNF